MSTQAGLEALIAHNMSPDAAGDIAQQPLIELLPFPDGGMDDYGARILVRARGGMVVAASLVAPSETQATPVLSNNAQDAHGLTVPKLDATFPMMPVGPNDGLGGQHGLLRYVNFEHTATLLRTSPHSRRVLHVLELEAALPPDSPISATRHIGFTALNEVFIATTIRHQSPFSDQLPVDDRSSEDLVTSLGEHVYLDMPDGAAVSDITLNRHSIDELLGEGAAADVAAGNPRLWRGFKGNVVARLSDHRRIKITSSTSSNRETRGATVHDMLLWRRVIEGVAAPTICLEPVAGFRPDASEGVTPIRIPRGESVTHRTIIRLLNAA